ncbi:hypothetical protein AB4238_17330, partial [Shewanella sp. 10N.286.45.A1]|uniref:hypothetical protein n=1 Tax=Shewanella sp. 10N.286.45.A1 TaxID=3229694 RepID=UPI0035529B81
ATNIFCRSVFDFSYFLRVLAFGKGRLERAFDLNNSGFELMTYTLTTKRYQLYLQAQLSYKYILLQCFSL